MWVGVLGYGLGLRAGLRISDDLGLRAYKLHSAPLFFSPVSQPVSKAKMAASLSRFRPIIRLFKGQVYLRDLRKQ